MNTRVLYVVALLVFCCQFVAAQDGKQPTVEERVNKLEELTKELQTKTQEIEKRVIDSESAIATLQGSLTDIQGQLEKIRNLVTEQSALMLKLSEAQKSEQSDAADQQPELRLRPIPTQGKVRIINQMATSQMLRINGQTYQVRAGATSEVAVPLGEVVTELVGFEAPKQWIVGEANNYVQEINIRPRQAIVSQRIMSPPVYIDPLYYW